MRPPTSRIARLLGAASCTAALGLAAACGGASAPASSAAGPSAAAAAPSHGAAGHGAQSGHGGQSGQGGQAGHSGHGGSGKVELYAVQTGGLGIVVTDGSGRLVYGSGADANNPPASRCTGACAQQWQPLVVPAGQEPDLLGVDADRVGRLAREDGSSQLTLGGWPVYVNRNDDGALKVASADAHGSWFVMTPQGQKVPV